MHIIFQQRDKAILEKSFELDETLKSDIFAIKDNYTLGPIRDIFSEEGKIERKMWWEKVYGTPDQLLEDRNAADHEMISEIIEKLNEDEDSVAWIWVAANREDVCGYYWVVSQLKDFVGRIFVLHLNNLPFINEKGSIFYPQYLNEIPAREFLKAKKLARPITLSEFELDPEEWKRISNEEKYVRTLEGAKKLGLHAENFYDRNLTDFISADWQKVSKVFQQFYAKSKNIIEESYLYWRINVLASIGTLETKGDQKQLKEYEVKQAIDQE